MIPCLCPTSSLCTLQGFTPGYCSHFQLLLSGPSRAGGLQRIGSRKKPSKGALWTRKETEPLCSAQVPKAKRALRSQGPRGTQYLQTPPVTWLHLWWQKRVNNASEPEAKPLGRCGPAEAAPASSQTLQGLGHHLRSDSVQPRVTFPKEPRESHEFGSRVHFHLDIGKTQNPSCSTT